MDTAAQAATSTAQDAANVLLAQGVLGVVCLILFATVGVLGFMLWKTTNGRIEAERGFRAEISTANAAVFTSISTLDKTMDLVRSLQKGG